MSNPVSVLLTKSSRQRAIRRDSRLLEREFAAIAAPSERLELESMFQRYPEDQTQEMREMLGRQAARLF